jgi:hypothetical protein
VILNIQQAGIEGLEQRFHHDNAVKNACMPEKTNQQAIPTILYNNTMR